MLRISKFIIAIALIGYGMIIMADVFNDECNLSNFKEVDSGWYFENIENLIFKTNEEKIKEEGEIIPENMIHEIARNAAITWIFEYVARGSKIEEIDYSGMESKLIQCSNKRIWIYKIKKIDIKY